MMHLVLIGFMASGKSTFAQQLSASLKLPVFSTDDWISSQTQLSISEIFTSYGENEFRVWEQRAYRVIMDLEQRYIIDCGGGFVLQGRMKELGRVYYLDVSLEIIEKRLCGKERQKRPLSKDFKELYIQRKRLYEKESLLKVNQIEEIIEDWKRINAPLP